MGLCKRNPKAKHSPQDRSFVINSSVVKRFVTERTFGTLKRVYGLHRARYLGLAKVQAEVLLKSIAYNLKRMRLTNN